MDVSPSLRTAGCALFSIDPTSLRSLNGVDGAVYLCRRGDRAHVIKFVPLAVERTAQFEEKLEFARELSENGLDLALPLPSNRGQRYECVQEEQERYAVTLTFLASGQHIYPRRPEWGPMFFFDWGRAVGRMHALALKLSTWKRDEPDEQAFATTDPCHAAHIIDWRMEYASFRDQISEPEIARRWEALLPALMALPVSREGFGLTHNDLHIENFMYHEGRLTILDFDCCAYHWFINDIGIALVNALMLTGSRTAPARAEMARAFLGPFRRGYQMEYHLDELWWNQLDTFIAYRQILVYEALSRSWIEGRRAGWQSTVLQGLRRAILASKPIFG